MSFVKRKPKKSHSYVQELAVLLPSQSWKYSSDRTRDALKLKTRARNPDASLIVRMRSS